MATAIETVQDSADVDELTAALEADGEDSSNVNIVTPDSFKDGEGGEDDTADDADEIKDGEDDADDKSGDDAGDDSAGDDAAADGSDGDDTGEADETAEQTRLLALEQENKDLRILMRNSRKDQSLLKAKLDRLEKTSQNTQDDLDDLDGDGDGGEVKADNLSRIEQLDSEIESVAANKGQIFDLMLEVMEGSEQYKDVHEVCSQEHFDDIFDSVATAIAEKNNKDYGEALREVQLSVWSKANPYKYMYKAIKDYHPAYQEAEEKGDAGKGKKDDKENQAEIDKRKKTAANAPDSVADLGDGDAGNVSGWTEARISALPEDELGKVPPDIYKKYMRNELK